MIPLELYRGFWINCSQQKRTFLLLLQLQIDVYGNINVCLTAGLFILYFNVLRIHLHIQG